MNGPMAAAWAQYKIEIVAWFWFEDGRLQASADQPWTPGVYTKVTQGRYYSRKETVVIDTLHGSTFFPAQITA